MVGSIHQQPRSMDSATLREHAASLRSSKRIAKRDTPARLCIEEGCGFLKRIHVSFSEPVGAAYMHGEGTEPCMGCLRQTRHRFCLGQLPRGSRYLIMKELGLKDHDYYGFWGLSP